MTPPPGVHIRHERGADAAAVRHVNDAAFQGNTESTLVELLRQEATPLISLVAEDDTGAIVGHILFSPVTLSSDPERQLMGLAPMSVIPDRQRHGIGSALVTRGLEECRTLGAGAVVVLGHPNYYPRFGFSPASRFELSCEYDVPDDVFMAIELVPGFLGGRGGTIRYHAVFSRV